MHGVAHQFDKQPGLQRFAHKRKFQFSGHRVTPRQFEALIAYLIVDPYFNHSGHEQERQLEARIDDLIGSRFFKNARSTSMATSDGWRKPITATGTRFIQHLIESFDETARDL